MKFLTKLIALILALYSIHLYCDINSNVKTSICKNEYAQKACQYTNPIYWNEQLTVQNQQYKDVVAPYVNNFHTQYLNSVKPVVVAKSILVKDLYFKHAHDSVVRYSTIAKAHIDDVHNKVLKPFGRNVARHVRSNQSVQDLLTKVKELDLCSKFNKEGLIRDGKVYIKAAEEKVVEVYKNAVAKYSEVFVTPEPTYFASTTSAAKKSAATTQITTESTTETTTEATTETTTETTTESTTETTTESAETTATKKSKRAKKSKRSKRSKKVSKSTSTTEEEEDLEPTTITSTLLRTVTKEIEINEDAVENEEDIVNKEIIDASENFRPPVDASIEEQFRGWDKMIDAKLNYYLDTFKKNQEIIETEYIGTYSQNFKKPIKELHEQYTHYRNELRKKIQEIDAVEKVVEKSGEKILLNPYNEEIVEKEVTRQYIRDLIKEALKNFKAALLKCSDIASAANKEANDEISKVRNIALKEYDSWYKSETKKWEELFNNKLNINNDGEKISKENANDEQKALIKRFNKLKRKATSKYSILQKRNLVLPDLATVIKDFENNVQAFELDFKEELAIMRAQANVAFQSREKKQGVDINAVEAEESAKKN
ncbi:hypothetical protein TPHA_0A05950 [Tetrapisispora phaffii CBS 4417]|uniref:Sensitivity to high expression protein 10 n=1 Tax=Tetrapisispora phaffii (strain ATCC 24235 / CBS 4417 / NBRC 1672 / NRRL Y-8282 / UCD 70-5) TaxID=1071381 RepID=G8BP41_TETPH|nr:hypothetical protein TPHA_0A05950 [Tetrapisispora phaffii CBS 4417]CCE61669.1 hypothetical protein TPHA_0A05950 [Tetrapisispora phaffii CBS 4417]